MLIEIEETPNNRVRNFYFNSPVLKAYQAEYADNGTSSPSTLSKNILGLGKIKRVLLLPDSLFVETKEDVDWSVLSPQIMAEIVEYDFSEFQSFDFSAQNVNAQIDALIEARIRPFLLRDGGNIDVLDLKDGALKVRLLGHCKGCPHAENTLKNTVEGVLKRYISNIKKVQKEDGNV